MAYDMAITRGGLVPSAILAIIGSRGPTSRADLARLLDVSSATMTQLTKTLLARGLIVELETSPSQGGRPARLLGLARSAGSAVGVKITADHVAVVQVELDGSVGTPQLFDFDPTRPDCLDHLAHVLEGAIAEMDGPLLGVGVGVPGSVDAQDSGIVQAPTLGWPDAQVGPMLRARLGLPVLVENDVNTLAVADRLYGAGQRHSTYIVVTIGRGIGCGVVVDGSVYRGAYGGAGEIGHIPIVYDDGDLCGCGSRGCLEAYVGEDAMLRSARRDGILSSSGTTTDLLTAADAGHEGAQAIYRRAGRTLGAALSGVVHTVDPEVVVLSGEGITAWPHWEPGFQEVFRRHLLPRWRSIPFLVHTWDESKWMLGAASLVLATPFDTVGVGGSQGRLVRDRLQDNTPKVSV
ncbi:Sugar kinase of the NBD/HSP70 family, may contain an N-terminal HTH domain [Nakamurella panacisegetis]|uniref:Sugar kinase of the NBD/HSP70 family, may contain an N-terminal HTH domain n=1 Tax=Nakamurella panacisegetis TaxID=1090615 RepID=A0A1H0KNF8_9ACTN|nr:ROK family transcriptional regulator [Nakamurella panacisegetis]SDO57405.1 Sugar kinase of the NBD/HSP70 family, may contain an N-terminal HTH domain [Nakamurella panacisegetis]